MIDSIQDEILVSCFKFIASGDVDVVGDVQTYIDISNRVLLYQMKFCVFPNTEF